MKDQHYPTGYEMFDVPTGSSPAYADLKVKIAIEHVANELGVGSEDMQVASGLASGLLSQAAAEGKHRIEQDNLATETGNNILKVLRSRL